MTIPIGVNYPAFNFGWDFGRPPLTRGMRTPAGGPQWYGKDAKTGKLTLEPLLRCWKTIGGVPVRWFILADGWNYDTSPPKHQPYLSHGGIYRFEPPPISKVVGFLGQFKLLLETFAAADLLLMPCLVDFKFMQKLMPVGGVPLHFKGGRGAVAHDPAVRKKFLENTVEPLVKLSAQYKQVILAWDVMNEPEDEEALMQAGGEKNMREFLVGCLQIVKRHKLNTTVGFRHFDTAKRWTDVAALIDWHQVHYYPESLGGMPLPKAADLEPKGKPKFLGEIATETVDTGAKDAPKWKELADRGKDTLYERLKLAEKQGYEAVFVWSVNGAGSYDANGNPMPDQRTRWDARTRTDLVHYATGKRPASDPCPGLTGSGIGDLARPLPTAPRVPRPTPMFFARPPGR